MNGEILTILEAIERDKGIDREILIQAVEAALATAAKKSLGIHDDQELTVTIDRKTGRLAVVSADRTFASVDFSRIAAQTARQVIIQKIREAEREVVFTEFQGRVGDIITGTVHRFEKGDIIAELGRAEAILPKSERIPHEDYRQGERIQAYVVEVRKASKGPAIVLSRTHEGFIRGLFSLEVPEIAEGIVEIKGIAREPGDRTKIAVSSKEEKVDCVGACVGMRGSRVKNIVREMHGEKIDIIRWHESVKEFIAAALSPAAISEIHESPETRQALVIVEDDQLSLAIGKRGQNVRLASKLTNWQLEIKSRSQLEPQPQTLQNVPGIGEALEARLREAGITAMSQLAALTREQLTQIKGIGEKTAEKLLALAKETHEAQATPVAVSPDTEATTDQSEAQAATVDEVLPPEALQESEEQKQGSESYETPPDDPPSSETEDPTTSTT